MNTNRPHIHLFETPGGYYIFDINKNSIIKTNKDTYTYLCYVKEKGFSSDCTLSEKDKSKLDRLKENGYLAPGQITTIIHPANDLLEYYLDNKLNMLTLQVTQQCNFRCEYCVYSGAYENRRHSGKKMGFERAKKGIDFLIEHSSGNERVSVGFYGGEPLLEFRLVKKIIEYTLAQTEGKEVIFNITTNGSLLTPEIADYFALNDVSMLISLDGPREIHNRNRKFAYNSEDTFEKVIENLHMIQKRNPDYSKKVMFSVVIDPENDYSCINEFFLSFDLVKDSTILPSFVSSHYKKQGVRMSEATSIASKYETFKMFLSKLDKLDSRHISPITSLDFELLRIEMHDNRRHPGQMSEKGHHSGPCIPGVSKLFMNVDGELFPCERVSESSEIMKIGHIDEGFYIDKIRRLLNIGQVTDKQCKTCFAFCYCTICAAFADSLTDISSRIKLNNCGKVRNSTESRFKDYCVLLEMGFNFKEGRLKTQIQNHMEENDEKKTGNLSI